MRLPEKVHSQIAEFRLGVPVFSSDGSYVGDLERLLIKPESWDIVAAVVKETRGFANLRFHPGTALIESDVIVPLSAIATKSQMQIDLNISAQEVRKLQPYLEFGPPELLPGVEEGEMETSAMLGGLALHPLQEHSTETADEIEVRPGENVMLGHEGDKLGHVDDVLTENNQLTGIVVKPSGLFTHDLVIPVRFLERSDNLALFVKLTADEITTLQRFIPDES